MTKRRVVITGIGVVSSIGIGRGLFGASLKAGHNGISRIQSFDPEGFPSQQAGEIPNYSPDGSFSQLDPAKVGRTSQMAVTAAGEALANAGLTRTDVARTRCGTVFGTTDGECQVIERLVRTWLAEDPASSNEAALFFSADTIGSTVAREFLLSGDAIVLSTACAAGNYAIGHAYDQIVSGAADIVICGGADSLSRKTYAGFTRLGAVAPDRCRPFDRNRKGIIPGEGAAALIVESCERAKARSARIHAEVLGYALTCDAKHMVAPDAGSIARCIQLAHGRSGISAKDVDYICAHGTGTPTNDVVEATAIRDVFGEVLPPTSSIKSMIGHTMGAASALAAVACCIALEECFIPPTINHAEPDPRCDLDCVPNTARSARLGIVQNNGFAFGGNNAVVLFGHPERLAT
jgi:3-oxoacyl-[acyl-carrier-protein] synthase II